MTRSEVGAQASWGLGPENYDSPPLSWMRGAMTMVASVMMIVNDLLCKSNDMRGEEGDPHGDASLCTEMLALHGVGGSAHGFAMPAHL